MAMSEEERAQKKFFKTMKEEFKKAKYMYQEDEIIDLIAKLGTKEAMETLLWLASNAYWIATTQRALAKAQQIMVKLSSETPSEETLMTIIDEQLRKRCLGKDYHDVATNAFPILEDRIRKRLGLSREYHGKKLLDHALNPTSGKLLIGDTRAEKEGVYHLFCGALQFLRNPPSHTLEVAGNIHSIELIFFIDLLLKIIAQATTK